MVHLPIAGCREPGNPLMGRSEDNRVANQIAVASSPSLQQSRLRSIHENLGKAHGGEQLENCQAVTCQIRYTLNLDKLSAFETYARIWISLIERYGGIHHGYFLPRAAPIGVGMSFPGLGYDGPADVAVAMFTFPNEESYRRYRKNVKAEPECQSAATLVRETNCFTRYERLFLQPVQCKLME